MSGTQALDFPRCVEWCTNSGCGVAESIMQTIVPTCPELNRVRADEESAPVFWHIHYRPRWELRICFGESSLEFGTVGYD